MPDKKAVPDGAKTGSAGGGGATAVKPQEGGMKVDFSKVVKCPVDFPHGQQKVERIEG